MLRKLNYSIVIGLVFLNAFLYLSGIKIISIAHLGLLAYSLLAITLAIGSFYKLFPKSPIAQKLFTNRRLFGLDTYFIALSHGFLVWAAYWQYSFSKVFDLSNFILSIVNLGMLALLLLTLLALSANDKVVKWLTYKRWKVFHRLIYLIFIFVFIHGGALSHSIFDKSLIISIGLLTIILRIIAFVKKPKS